MYLTVISEASAGLFASMYDTVVLAWSAEAPAPMIDWSSWRSNELEQWCRDYINHLMLSTCVCDCVREQLRFSTELLRNFTLNHNGFVS